MGLAAVLALAVLAAGGCGGSRTAPQSAAPVVPPRAWPQGRAAPMRITDDLTLAVPRSYERAAIERGPVAPGDGPAGVALPGSAHGEVRFDFFLPGFSGYTLQNYKNDADPDKVEVVYLHAGNPHEADPDAPGEYPPNMLKRQLEDLLDPKHYSDRYGLRCYRGRVFTSRLTCFGRRDAQNGEDIMLTTLVPPYPESVTFPVFQARYFSTRYGGVRIEWRAHVSQLPHWREIDAQVWKFIAAWKVAAAGEPSPGPPHRQGLNRS